MTRKAYLREVEWQLRDVPWKRRKQLLAELAAHLDETPAEQLDSPPAYAAELCESAGLPRKHGVVAFIKARRPRNLVFVGAAVVIVALLSSGFVWVESYQPLVIGDFGISPPDSKSGAARETVVTFHEGKPFEYGFTVRNGGAFTVRITGVPLPRFQPFATKLFASMPLPYRGAFPGPIAPFRPFDLAPGQERLLLLRGVFVCHGYGGSSAAEYTSMPARFGFLWRTGTVDVNLLGPLIVQFPRGLRCSR